MLLPEKIYKKYMELYPYCKHYMELFRQDKGTELPDWNDWCYLPISAYYSIVYEAAIKENIPMNKACSDIGNLAGVSIWGISKGVYKFDNTLLDKLWETTIDNGLDIELLYQLPEWCCYIDLENFDKTEIKGFFVYLEDDVSTKDTELRFTTITPDNRLFTNILHLRKEGIKASFEETFKYSKLHNPKNSILNGVNIKKFSNIIAKSLEPFVSIILYLCAVNADISNPITQEKPKRPKILIKNNKEKIKVAKQIKEYRVGGQIGAAIRRASGNYQKGTDRTVTPHIRRSHFHSFWTGSKDNKVKVVKWLPPIPVNLNGEEIIPVVRKVKNEEK